jgi:formylglycine-generating enzyme required for sulfatase activity
MIGRRYAGLLVLLMPGLTLLAGTDSADLPEPWRRELAGHRSYRETLPDSLVHLEMAAIPGGTFWMGSPEGEKGRDRDEGPRRRVKVRPFWMSTTEVTWDAYDLYRKGPAVSEEHNEAALHRDADAITRPTPTYLDEYRDWGKEGMPVVSLSHHAAMEFCRWLSKVSGRVYRLPTEAEWEWATRAGTETPWFFGSDPTLLGAYAWYDANGQEMTHPVGTKKANPWGLHDIYGNVAEWCVDHYDRDDYARSPADRLLIAPVRLPTERRYSHVVRGGSWADSVERCRSAARRGSDRSWNKMDPMLPQTLWWQWDADFVGFRVVRAVEEQPELRGLRSKLTRKSK